MAWFDMIYTSELLFVFAFVRAFVNPSTDKYMLNSLVFKIRVFAGVTQLTLVSIAIGYLHWQCGLAAVVIRLLDWLFITIRFSKVDVHRAAGLTIWSDTAIYVLSSFSLINFVFERPSRQSEDTLVLPEHWLGIATNSIATIVLLMDYYYVRTWTDAWGCYETTSIDEFNYGYCPGLLHNYKNSEVCRQYEPPPLPHGCNDPNGAGQPGVPPATTTATTYVAYIALKILIGSSVLYVTSTYSVIKDLQLRAMLSC